MDGWMDGWMDVTSTSNIVGVHNEPMSYSLVEEEEEKEEEEEEEEERLFGKTNVH